ncbi:MAG: DUF551 domain-containing protein [Patescibacteria group bacterium]|nr:DUF551 domain-containing protein [Patescibacteria group bacterium]
MNQWQPIETAPKDGTKIDLFVMSTASGRGGRIPDCVWQSHKNKWKSHWFHGNGFEATRVSWFEPTHWRPIPEPPK